MSDWYMGTSPEGYADWLAWKAGEVEEPPCLEIYDCPPDGCKGNCNNCKYRR